jgi:hypothetical protein
MLFYTLPYFPDLTRETILFLYGILVGVLFLFGSELLGRYLNADKQMRSDAAYMIFFIISIAVIGYGIYMIPAIIDYFYLSYDNIASVFQISSDFVFGIQTLAVLIILIPFGMVAEKILWRKSKLQIKIGSYTLGFNALLGLILIILLSIEIILFITNPTLAHILYTGIFVTVWIGFAFFGFTGFFGIVNVLFKRLNPQKDIRKQIFYGLFIGAIGLIGSVGAGILGRIPYMNGDPMGSVFYIGGTILEIIGWFGMRHFFLKIRSYSEIEWKSSLDELHIIIADSGLSIYYRSFKNISIKDVKGDMKVTINIPEQEDSHPDTDLIAGGMIGIRSMLGEIAQTKGSLENIQIGNRNLIFKQGYTVMALLLADKDLGVYHSILMDLTREIEEANPNIANFTGNTQELTIAPIVDRYFGLSQAK